MNIGLLTTSISRQSGGLMWAIRSLAQYLVTASCRVTVFSGKDNDTAADLAYWVGIDVMTMNRFGPSSFGYMPALQSALRNARLDLIHSHGIWMYPSVAALNMYRVDNRPLVVSPHGMLDPWALRNSTWKKRIAALTYENAHLRAAACLHALCDSEYAAMRAYGLRNPVAIIPNGVDLPMEVADSSKSQWFDVVPVGSRVLLYLSRIHPKKGLGNLLQAWAQVKQASECAVNPWHLVIAGWGQEGHYAELERMRTDLGIKESVHFVGPQYDLQKTASFNIADAFVLPSVSEGLPIAVLEAWSYSLPVLMTPECNLPEGFAANAAIEMAPEVSSISRALTILFNMTDFERQSMGKRGRGLVEQAFTWPGVARSMKSVYSWILGHGQRPGCVVMD